MTADDIYAQLATQASRVLGAAHDPDDVPSKRALASSRVQPLGSVGPSLAIVGIDADERTHFRSLLEALSTDGYWRHTDVAQQLIRRSDQLDALIDADPDVDDPEWRIYEVSEDIKDLLRMMYRRLEREALDDSILAVRFIARQLSPIEDSRLDALLDVEQGDYFRRVRAAEEANDFDDLEVPWDEARAILTAQLIYDLRNSATPEGVIRWFWQPLDPLDGTTPIDAMRTRGVHAAGGVLREVAQRARAQVAS
jgi:hypothetical protein